MQKAESRLDRKSTVATKQMVSFTLSEKTLALVTGLLLALPVQTFESCQIFPVPLAHI
jgi:hypothetical protein